MKHIKTYNVELLIEGLEIYLEEKYKTNVSIMFNSECGMSRFDIRIGEKHIVNEEANLLVIDYLQECISTGRADDKVTSIEHVINSYDNRIKVYYQSNKMEDNMRTICIRDFSSNKSVESIMVSIEWNILKSLGYSEVYNEGGYMMMNNDSEDISTLDYLEKVIDNAYVEAKMQYNTEEEILDMIKTKLAEKDLNYMDIRIVDANFTFAEEEILVGTDRIIG